MVFSIDSEEYKRGLKYEVIIECITMEMAYHSAHRYEAGRDTEHGRIHFEAMKALKKLRDSLNPRDESTVRNAWLTLDAMRASRMKTVNQSEPAPLAQNAACQSVAVTEPVAAAC